MMRITLLFAFLLIPNFVFASPAEEREDTSIPILESARELFGVHANYAANRLDSFFATERADDEFGRSRIRIRSRLEFREKNKYDIANTYRINLKLPSLENKFKFKFIDKDKNKKKDKKAEAQNKVPPSAKEEIEQLRNNKLYEGWLFNTDVGVTAAIPPRLTIRSRVRKNFVTGTLIHRFVEQLIYTTGEDGLTEETRIDSDHAYSDNLLFRFVNFKRWRVLEKNFITEHGPNLIQRLTDDDALSYGIGMGSVIENSTWYVNNYRVSINYRRNLYKQWVYFDTIPGIDFPKTYSFRRNPFITFQLEILFGT